RSGRRCRRSELDVISHTDAPMCPGMPDEVGINFGHSLALVMSDRPVVRDEFPCPCCGHIVFGEPPDSYDLCPICFWEDENVQLRWPDWAGGANRPSLIDSQRNYRETGAMELRFTGKVRQPRPHEPIDEGWRAIDPTLDSFESVGVPES